MNYLLDTHTFIWFIEGDVNLSTKTKMAIANISNKCFISIASLWEITIKSSIGKLKLNVPFSKISDFLAETDIKLLQIEFDHLLVLMNLPFIHKDPFDRIIIAQAASTGYTLFTNDTIIPQYPITCDW
jgi:PIN domain nuclease of toxin-antitoxin system